MSEIQTPESGNNESLAALLDNYASICAGIELGKQKAFELALTNRGPQNSIQMRIDKMLLELEDLGKKNTALIVDFLAKRTCGIRDARVINRLTEIAPGVYHMGVTGDSP